MNIGVIVEAKQEYTRQMINILQPLMYEAFITLYTNALEEAESEYDILKLFKTELQTVSNWNSVIVNKESERILKECPYFNDLLTAVVLSNVKILTSIRLQNKKQNVQVTVPTNETFVLQLYTVTSKKILNNINLFDASRYDDDISNNINDVYDLIDGCVQHTIRTILPVEDILKSTLTKGEDESKESGSESDGEKDPPTSPRDAEAMDEESDHDHDLDEDGEEENNEERTVSTTEPTMMDNLFSPSTEETAPQANPPGTVPMMTQESIPAQASVPVQAAANPAQASVPVYAAANPPMMAPAQVSVPVPATAAAPTRSFFDDVED